MSTASGARSRTCSSESQRSASTTIASGSSPDTASISAPSVSAAATTSNPLVPSRTSMLPTWPAVITRRRSLHGSEPAAGACGEAEPSWIDVAIGSWWIVVDDLLYEPLSTIERAAGHVARWFYGRRHDGATRPSPVRTIDARSKWWTDRVGAPACRPTSAIAETHRPRVRGVRLADRHRTRRLL